MNAKQKQLKPQDYRYYIIDVKRVPAPPSGFGGIAVEPRSQS